MSKIDRIADYGPAAQRHMREVEEAPDPAQPNRTILRARKVPHYVTLWRKGCITEAGREACDRYAITSEAEKGARQQGGMERVDGPQPGGRGHPTMGQVQASASLRNAHVVVGNDGAALLRLYVRDGHTMAAVAIRRHEREEVTKGRILAAITRLSEHWGME